MAQTRAGFRRRRDYLETLTSNNPCQWHLTSVQTQTATWQQVCAASAPPVEGDIR